jgi:hypothetical protein
VLELLYGPGLRVREGLRLDRPAISLAQAVCFVREGKRRQDRVAPWSVRHRLSAVESALTGDVGRAGEVGDRGTVEAKRAALVVWRPVQV